MEIRQFQSFKTVADLASFTKAANTLQYSQASITSHIQQLETEMGVPLFDRLGKQIQLTAMGEELYLYVSELLTAYTKILHLSSDDHMMKGDLRIGASETMTIFKLGPMLSRFKEACPHVSISLINDHCVSLREKLHSGELDIAITFEPQFSDPQLHVEVCKEEPLIFVGSRHHTLNSIEEASGECLIFSEENCSLRRVFEEFLSAKGLSPVHHLSFSSMETMKQCVVSGLGISLMPYLSVEGLLKEGKMKLIPSNNKTENFVLYPQICYHKNKWLSKAHKKFIEMVLATFERVTA